jgi:RNA polymerase sigma-70 factor (ECF subfamily)
MERAAKSPSPGLADLGLSPSSAMRERERSLAIAEELARLKPEYRDVIVLRNLEGLSFDEIGRRMNRRTGTVRMLWLRAMEKLKGICKQIE